MVYGNDKYFYPKVYILCYKLKTFRVGQKKEPCIGLIQDIKNKLLTGCDT